MVNRQQTMRSAYRRLGWKLLASTAIAIAAAGCTKTSKTNSPQAQLAAFNYSKQAQRQPLQPNHPMHIAASKWARKHQKNPADAQVAVNYIRSLKAIGSKERAMEVAVRSYQMNPGHPELASEYGRLALDQGKVQLAEQLLNQAMHARGAPDWKTLSAMGTIQAKRGDHLKAQSYYVAALKQQPGATSVYNNLALSYALDGKAGHAEKLLKDAVNKGHNTQVLRQNLALVLGIQSKFDEAQQIAQADLDTNRIDNNVTFLRKMVKTTKVAKAPKREPIRTAKADMTTTASLPKQKPTPAATRTRVQPTTIAAAKPKAPSPVRKPAAPAQISPKVARSLSAEQKPEMARPLPWQTKSEPAPVKKSGPKAPQQKQVPATATVKKPDKPPARTHVASLEKKPAPSWSMTVTEAVDTGSASQPEKNKTFKFPVATD